MRRSSKNTSYIKPSKSLCVNILKPIANFLMNLCDILPGINAWASKSRYSCMENRLKRRGFKPLTKCVKNNFYSYLTASIGLILAAFRAG